MLKPQHPTESNSSISPALYSTLSNTPKGSQQRVFICKYNSVEASRSNPTSYHAPDTLKLLPNSLFLVSWQNVIAQYLLHAWFFPLLAFPIRFQCPKRNNVIYCICFGQLKSLCSLPDVFVHYSSSIRPEETIFAFYAPILDFVVFPLYISRTLVMDHFIRTFLF